MRFWPSRRTSPPIAEIHFLHISKCAGTQLTSMLSAIEAQDPRFRFVYHGHHVKLRQIPPDVHYVFPIRDPIARFRSGFYSRKRKGAPRHQYEWSPYEGLAFAEFEHANDLAEALFHPGDRGERAFAAITSIGHTAKDQVDWFTNTGNFLRVRPPVGIIRTEHFDEDVAYLLSVLDIDPSIATTTDDPVGAHANDYSGTPDLSPLARENLRRWYAQDVELYRACESWIASQAGGRASL